MKLDKVKEAGADYRKALELDSSLGLAATGLAVVQVLEGEVDAGIKTLEDARGRVELDALFHYNAACVYGRAAEAAAKSPASPARDARLAEHRKAALTDLEKSVKSGFQDFEWMKQDPDLKPLADDPQFKKLSSGMMP
jgi:Flp pilus assembly protein TadD